MFLFNFFGTIFLFFVQQSSFEVHTVYKEITPFGWFVIIFFPLAIIFGIVFLIVKILKKTKLK